MRTLNIVLATVASLGVAAAAQAQDNTRNNLQPGQQPQTQPQPVTPPPPTYVTPAPRSPMSGVPAGQPRPTSLPQVAPQVGVPTTSPGPATPIIPPSRGSGPVYTPPVTGNPVIGNGNADSTRSNLVRRLLDYKYGPGYSLVDGRVVGPMKPMMNGWGGGSTVGWGFGGPGVAVPVINPTDGAIRGLYNSSDYQIGFSLGNNYPLINYRPDLAYGKYPQRLYRSYFSAYEDWDRYNNQPCGYYTSPYMIVGSDQSYVVDPRLTATTDAAGVQIRELTPLEKAEIDLRTGDAADAVRQLKQHLKTDPDDAAVERLLAMALLDDRKVEQGVAVLAHAYLKQPRLANDAIDPSMLSGGEVRHRARFSAVMDYASRVKTGSAYLAASVLAQSEGRFEVAQKLLDKAVDAGLDKKIAEELKVAIANR